ncbi:hypothetical protein ACN4EK_24175 [Pantanalinema rosaneae CENA516]|uniref:hypothetical protein n=1 Tax=Pantanalinema rosaneae TaxID=1620701 RepID=UPI003D6FD28F
MEHVIPPKNSKITAFHIRYAKTSQIARIFETTKANASQWIGRKRGISEKQLQIAARKGISISDLLEGIECKRRDLEIARECQKELEAFLSNGKDNSSTGSDQQTFGDTECSS